MILDENSWTPTPEGVEVNDNELGPWESAIADDEIIRTFLKKRFIKERLMMIIFQIVVVITCFFGVIELLMLYDDILLAIVIGLIGAVTMACLYINFQDIQILRKYIEDREYQTCVCQATDIRVTNGGKFCNVEDSDGHPLMSRFEGSEPVPARISYQGYFSGKDRSAKLLRAKTVRGKVLFYVFPEFYLQGGKEEDNN